MPSNWEGEKMNEKYDMFERYIEKKREIEKVTSPKITEESEEKET